MKQFLICCVFGLTCLPCLAQVWQWGISINTQVSAETNNRPHAFLWIPENCKKVRAVVLAQHNMIEEGVLQNTAFRKTMAALDIAEVWVTPFFSLTFDFEQTAPQDFNAMMQKLADSSGYAELVQAPVIPLGHSALASFPWNFGAWDKNRTLAIISIHGDAPLTPLTGSGQPNPRWGNRDIDGVPALFIMGEYEWWEYRIMPGFSFVQQHPQSPVTFLADAGHGHFDYSQQMIDYLCLFIKKAAQYRLPPRQTGGYLLTPVKPSAGWLVDRWRKDSLPLWPAAPYRYYKGNRLYASWVFDEQMAASTEHIYAMARGRQAQYLAFKANGQQIQPSKTAAIFNVPFTPGDDGITFKVGAFFTDSLRQQAALRHAPAAPVISRITGPVYKVNDSVFRLDFYRMGLDNSKRSNDVWLLAADDGDAVFKSTVQQAELKFPLPNANGKPQAIFFPAINDQEKGVREVKLAATSDAGMQVRYYVKYGPAIIVQNRLLFTKIPPRSKYPIKVSVVAWQYGRTAPPAVQSAAPVENIFFIGR